MGRRAGIDASQFGIPAFTRVGDVIGRLAGARGSVTALALIWGVGLSGGVAVSSVRAVTVGEPSPVMNEILYDPPGKDAGLEFVEIFNPSSKAVGLEGWRLETGNGSYADRWTLEWTGSSRDSIGAGCFFVVGEEAVTPVPDAVTDLDLQNGPDACRLVSPERASDVVGWGEHVYPEYYEGQPAVAASSGLSLGRDPDGDDSNNNAADFIELERASPGDFNHPPCDLTILRAGTSRYGGSSGPDLDLVCLVQNLGTQPCGAGALVRASLGALEASSPILDSAPPTAQAKVVVRLPNPGAGLHGVRAWLECDSDSRTSNDSLSTSVMVPPSPVVINEVMFRPASGDCEWVEIANHSGGQRHLRGWHIADSGGRLRALTDTDVVLEAGGFLVLVENEDAFAASYLDSQIKEAGEIAFLKPKGGWPNLNDADGPLGFADTFVLKDSFGTTADSVAYGEDWSRPGVSVERVDPAGASTAVSNWSPHYGSAAGSPGAPNSVTLIIPEAESILSLSPPSFTPDGDGRDDVVAISVRLAAPSAVRVSVFDVNGRLVRRLVDGETVAAQRITFWDGCDDDGSEAPTGVYLVGLEVAPASGQISRQAKAVVVLARR